MPHVHPAVVASPRERPVLFRARTGLRCTTFPEPEGIIPENEGINPAEYLILRRR